MIDAPGTDSAFSSSINNFISTGLSTEIWSANPLVNIFNFVNEESVLTSDSVPITPFALAEITELPIMPVVSIGNKA